MRIKIHGPGTPTRWVQKPTMHANITFNSNPVRDGDSARANISVSLDSLTKNSTADNGWFGYYLGLLVKLTPSAVDTSASSQEQSGPGYGDTDMMIQKPASDSEWNSTDYQALNVNISLAGISPSTKTVYLTVYLRSNCTCVSGSGDKHTYPVYCQPFTIEAKKYTVTFYDYQGGSVISTQQVEYGESATPPSPTREGYNFLGWSDTYTNITANKTIYGLWEVANPKVWVYTSTGWQLVPYVYNYDGTQWNKVT